MKALFPAKAQILLCILVLIVWPDNNGYAVTDIQIHHSKEAMDHIARAVEKEKLHPQKADLRAPISKKEQMEFISDVFMESQSFMDSVEATVEGGITTAKKRIDGKEYEVNFTLEKLTEERTGYSVEIHEIQSLWEPALVDKSISVTIVFDNDRMHIATKTYRDNDEPLELNFMFIKETKGIFLSVAPITNLDDPNSPSLREAWTKLVEEISSLRGFAEEFIPEKEEANPPPTLRHMR